MKQIIKRHPYILSFGVLQIFFSAPGQTFFIALFVPYIFKDMNISLSLFAGLYSFSTMTAALLLNPAGRLIDKYPIKNIVTCVTFFMASGCWLLSISQNVQMLFISFLILRLLGQGVYGLTASTLIIKKFHKNRGKAMGIVTQGFPLSEMIFPTVGLLLLNSFGWRTSYIIFGFMMIALMLPIQLYLISKSKLKKGHFLPGEELINPQRLPGQPNNRRIREHKDYKLKQVLKDFKFYLILTASSVPPLVVTGLFFHQSTLFSSNQWPIALAATGLSMYAISKAIGSILIGPVVDKYGPLKPFIAIILLLSVGTFFAGWGSHKIFLYLYFIVIGTALGFGSPVMNVVWPHFYGTKHMGSIKGFIATFRNGLTALGPLPIAIALDNGYSINKILIFISCIILTISILPIVAWKIDEADNTNSIK